MFRFLLAVLLLSGIGSVASNAEDKADPKKKSTPVVADPTSGDQLERLVPALVGTGHQYPIINLLFTSDSKRLITVGSNRVVCIWDVATGAQLKVYHLPGRSRMNEAAL